MLSRVRDALQARQAAMLEAEALVYRFGARGVAMARSFAQDATVTEARRGHYRRVARIADRRQSGIQGLDVATRYVELARWRSRAGALIGRGDPLA